MKVLMLNGSPHENGNTTLALREMMPIFEEAGIEVDYVQVGQLTIKGCTGCAACFKLGKCVQDDIVNVVSEKFKECDGMIVASPVYYASANGTLVSFLDRLFYSSRFDKTMKVGAALAVARRGGTTATYDELNKYFSIAGMPIASGQYWNILHGRDEGEAALDGEGMQNLRTLARNMVFLMRSIALGKEAYGLPPKEEPKIATNFIR